MIEYTISLGPDAIKDQLETGTLETICVLTILIERSIQELEHQTDLGPEAQKLIEADELKPTIPHKYLQLATVRDKRMREGGYLVKAPVVNFRPTPAQFDLAFFALRYHLFALEGLPTPIQLMFEAGWAVYEPNMISAALFSKFVDSDESLVGLSLWITEEDFEYIDKTYRLIVKGDHDRFPPSEITLEVPRSHMQALGDLE